MTHPTNTDPAPGNADDRVTRYPRAWDAADDEISLFDLYDALMRRRWLIVGVTAAVAALAFGYALIRPDTFRYRQVLEVGSRLSGGEVRLIESPSSVAAKLNENYIPAEVHEWAANRSSDDTSDTGWEPDVEASVPSDAQLVVLSAVGTPERGETITRIMERAARAMKKDHNRVIETIQEEIRSKLTDLHNQVEGAKDKRERLQAQLKRVGERESLIKEQVVELKQSIAEAEASRRDANQNLDGASQAMTLLMLSNELRQARERLAELRTELRVELADTRDQLKGQIAEQKRRVESKRAEIKRQQVQLDNLSRTQPLGPPQPSLSQAGTSGKLILALGIVLGGMLGVFSTFLAEFVAAARRRNAANESVAEPALDRGEEAAHEPDRLE